MQDREVGAGRLRTCNRLTLTEGIAMEQHHDAQTAHKKIDIEAMSARIRSASPPAKELTRRETVEALKPSLLEAIAFGHTPTSLATLLREDGLKVGARTLALWLNVSGASDPKSRTRKRAKAPAA